MLTRRLNFHSDAVPRKGTDDGLLVSSFEGTEAISKPFTFRIKLVSKATAEVKDISGLLTKDAYLEITPGGKQSGPNHRIHGVLASFEVLARGADWIKYEAVLVPPLWYLSLYKHTRIFMNKSVPDIVKDVLAAAKIPAAGFTFNLKNEGAYPKSEYLVQYQETDLNFVSRLLEKEGICYFFKHSEAETKLVFGDHADAFAALAPNKTVPLRAEAADGGAGIGDQWEREEAIFSIGSRQQVVATEVVLKDYNYRKPSGDLKITEPVAGDATVGRQYEYGHHYKDADDGKRLAKVRAEEAACQRVVFSGESDIRGLRGGCVYTIDKRNGPPGALGEESLVIDVSHRGQQGLAVGGGDPGSTSYRNSFHAIPHAVPFRPARRAEKPFIAGSMNATVDSGTSGEYADIDKEGRYLVALPFDLSGAGSGKASRYIRMAQPYGGKDMGMHFPLHKGTEVLLTHIDGDPDRPIISATVPNPETPSLIQQDTHTQAVIKTGGNNELRFEDAKGGEKVFLHAQKDHEVKVENDEAKSIGAKQTLSVGSDQSQTIGGNRSSTVSGNHDHTVNGDENTTIGGAQTNKIGASQTNTIGAGQTNTIAADQTSSIGASRTETIASNHTETIGGSQTVTVAINSAETIGVAKELTIGAAYQVSVGAAMNETVGAVKAVEVGASSSETVGSDKSVTVAGGHTEAAAKQREIKAKTIKLEATDEIQLIAGSASITMNKNGDIVIEGKAITIKGSGDVVIKGAKIQQN